MRYRFHQLLFIISLLLSVSLVFTPIVKAQTFTSPSPKASPTPSVSPKVSLPPQPTASPELSATSSSQVSLETTEKLKARIEKIVQERRNQIMGALTDVGKVRKGFIGEIVRISDETITIKTSKGTQVLSLTKEVMMTKNGKAIAVNAIAVGDWGMVIGFLDNDSFVPELIDISSQTLRPKNQRVLIGTIIEIKKNTLKIKHRSKEEELVFNLTKQSEIFDNEGNPLEQDDLETQLQVLTVAQESTSGLELSSLKVLSAVGGNR